jgi:N-acetylglutamate synthase-like GNAT family acetyltransferase
MDNRLIQFAIIDPHHLTGDFLHQLQHLLNLGAFWAQGRSIDDLAIALKNSEPIVAVWDKHQLIGHARAISDGVYRAILWDVVVHPDYQGRGLGRKLVQTVLSHPKLARVERIYLTTTHQQEFYQRIGFVVNPSQTMVLLNQSAQSTTPLRVCEEITQH